MIEQDFEDIIAITSAEGALSADTDMREMLLVATRRKNPGAAPSPVHCVTLRYLPEYMGEANEMNRAVRTAPLFRGRLSRPRWRRRDWANRPL